MKHRIWFGFTLALSAAILVGCSTHTKSVVSPPSAGVIIDDGDGGGGAPPPCTINVPTSGTVSATGTLTIPITISNFTPPQSGDGEKVGQVTILLSAGLRLSPNLSAVRPGSYLTSSSGGNDPSPIWSATYNADSTITVVWALNPGKCCSLSSGTVINLTITPKASHSGSQYVGLVSSPAGALTPSPTIGDCDAVWYVGGGGFTGNASYGNATDTITIN